MVHHNYGEKLLCIIHHLPLEKKKTIDVKNLFSGEKFWNLWEKKIDFVTTVFRNLTSYLEKEF